MTTEQKAKAYDEALRKIQPLYERAKKENCPIWSTYEHIFPTLAESEDERIRKFLVDYFTSYKIGNVTTKLNGVRIDDILAYLEKQKPMYNLEIPAGDVAPAEENGSFDEDEFLENELSAFLQNYDKEYDDDAAVSDVARHFYEIGKKQKEQIPYIDFVIKPHKGDDTNPYDMSVSEAQEYAIKRGFGIPFNDGEVYVDERHITQTIGNIIRWADEHPKKQKEQKPVEIHIDNPNIQKFDPDVKVTTSDSSAGGDELLYVSNKSYNIGFRDGVASVKPTEWSEEDETYLQGALWCVKQAEKSCKDEDDKGACWSAERWLKSIRPSWKPSEEQMSRFVSIVAALRKDYCDDMADFLASIYEQLKKLM